MTVGKLGAPVEMLLQLGDDEPGRGYVEHFKSFGVETRNIKLLKNEDTGKAIIKADLCRTSLYPGFEGW